jgi:hypothetical protein
MIENRDEWMVEGCWAGRFEDGGFDLTDLFFGSGIRIRNGTPIFVPSGTTCDRLWWHSSKKNTTVSNSLPALLSITNSRLLPDYDYTQAISTIRHGSANYQKDMPIINGTIHVQYFHNVFWDGRELVEIKKPSQSKGFTSYDDYSDFLSNAAEKLGSNAASKGRRHRVGVLTTVSRGYDSLVGAVLAQRHMGCKKAVTIRESSSLWRGTDAGTEIAKQLGLECKEYPRKSRSVPNEEAFWAVAGKAMELNWAQFDYSQPLCLFITGVHGDTMWGLGEHCHEDPFATPSLAGTGICEFRLLKGIFHCPVPFWGLRSLPDIQRISNSKEMKPWSLGGSYDRPVARRIVEEAGIARKAFGRIKMNTQVAPYVLWPYSRNAQQSATRFARSVGVSAPSPSVVRLWRLFAQSYHLVYKNLFKPLGMSRHLWAWDRLGKRNNLFHWANANLTQMIISSAPAFKLISNSKRIHELGASSGLNQFQKEAVRKNERS